jgi:hypothetical protein
MGRRVAASWESATGNGVGGEMLDQYFTLLLDLIHIHIYIPGGYVFGARVVYAAVWLREMALTLSWPIATGRRQVLHIEVLQQLL